MKIFLALLLILVGFNFTSAQSNWENFKKQSAPIKKWILLHPFKAKKAYVISLEAQKVADSISKTNVLDGDAASGQVDAFRHAYWMAHLNQKIGKCASLSLGRAYERSNKKSFRKSRRKAEISSYDKPSKQMDLFNNKIGVTFTKKKMSILKITKRTKKNFMAKKFFFLGWKIFFIGTSPHGVVGVLPSTLFVLSLKKIA